ncbi:MAG: AmmeMemoRadiSam system protein B [Myxococcales bacterium]|nr:AmmeMemoRadiSam system protein B [Myxococcales bacterium]
MVQPRHAAAAGILYPADRDDLLRMVENLLEAAERSRPRGKTPRAIIVPHGPYESAGPVAAAGWARLLGSTERIERVVISDPPTTRPSVAWQRPSTTRSRRRSAPCRSTAWPSRWCGPCRSSWSRTRPTSRSRPSRCTYPSPRRSHGTLRSYPSWSATTASARRPRSSTGSGATRPWSSFPRT